MRTTRAIMLLAGLTAFMPTLSATEDAVGDVLPTSLDATPIRSLTPRVAPIESVLSATRVDKTIKSSTTLSLEGEGTEASPYLIGTAADWNTLAAYMVTDSSNMANSYIKLTADIDFTDVTATPLYEFAGDFNGDSKSIKGLNAAADTSYCGGLFTLATSTSNIHDFSVYGQYAALSYSGAVVGTTYGTVTNVASYVAVSDSEAESTTYCISGIVGAAGSTATISGCTYGDTITASGAYASGIVGYSYYCTISECVNSGYMTVSSGYAAGITAYAYGATVKDCTNKAGITCYGEGGGGITAYAAYSTISGCSNEGAFYGTGYLLGNIAGSIMATTITGCSNSGTLTQTNTTYGYSGGIVGQMDTLSVATDCVNSGKLTLAGPYSGGVVGFAHYSTVTGSSNQGAVTTTASQASGGVMGYAQYSTLSTLTNTAALVSTTNYFGGVAGYIYACDVTGAVNKGSITQSSKICSGGLFGAVSGSSAVADSYNEGALKSATTYAGGVVGLVSAGCSFTNCHNSGAITYTGSSSQCFVGGFASQVYASTYTDCYNTGKMTLSASAQYVAGLIGYAYNATSSTSEHTFTRCYNTADITANSYVAGLIGYSFTNVRVNMTGCYNTGNISTSSSSTAYVAGLSVYYCRKSTYTDCYNTGAIKSVAGSYTAGLFSINRTSSSSTLKTYLNNCYNTGTVTAAGDYAAGIASYLASFISLDSCYNTGTVTLSASGYVGGLLAYVSSASSTVSNCYNAGDVTQTGTSYTGGIVGYTGSMTYSNVFNCGNITGNGQTGGIFGCSASSSLTNAYNTGAVSGSYAGGIVGYSTSTSISLSYLYNTGSITGTTSAGPITGGTETSTISNAYYLSTTATGGDYDTVATSVTYAELAKLDLGDDWTAGDNYTYPRLTTLADNDYAKAYAAAVVPADGDSYSSITQGFNVGTPDGVTWTASSSSVEIDGNNVTFSESFSGTLTMTATSGDVSVATELTCNVVVSGISDITGAAREVVSEKYYTISGAQVAEPSGDSKAIYIVVKTYSDGTTETVKETR